MNIYSATWINIHDEREEQLVTAVSEEGVRFAISMHQPFARDLMVKYLGPA